MPSATPTTRSEQTIIQVENFRAAYNGNTVLEHVSFEIPRGCIMVIAGGSGCGKSTMMKHMIGLYTPADGRITLDGYDVAATTGQARRDMLRRIGVMYQSGALFGSMTLLENVRMPLEEFTDLPGKAMNVIAMSKLKLVGLDHAAGSLPAQISGGMQKRAAIARAIALDPAMVFLDEPSAGLDPITSAGVDELILDLRDMLNMTFIVVTHELPSIFAIADECVVLDAAEKTIIAQGPPKQLRDESDHPKVNAFFNRKSENPVRES